MTSGISIYVACVTSMRGNERMVTAKIMKLVSTSVGRDLPIYFYRVPVITYVNESKVPYRKTNKTIKFVLWSSINMA